LRRPPRPVDPDFNGAHIAPEPFNTNSTEYVIHVTFRELTGIADAERMVFRATATDVMGNSTQDSM
jgi:hypothetical protein